MELLQASLLCGSMVGEMARLSRKTMPLEPLKDWSHCPLELTKALLELQHAQLQLLWATLEFKRLQ